MKDKEVGLVFEVIFFATDAGWQPVKEFLDGLDVKMRNKVLDNLKHLQIHGNHLREPYSKPLGDGIFELRTRFGSDITRAFYFFYIGNRIVLTHGFVKKTQKTPQQEIERAREYRAMYHMREENHDG